MAYFQLSLVGTRLQVALVALIIAPSFILFGYNQAVLGGLLSLPSWVSVFPDIDTIDTTGAQKSHNATSQGACNASFQMGCLLGALSLSFYGDKLGRRKTTFTGAAITIVGQALQVSATTLAQFVVGRVILGFAIGQISGTVPVWLSECAPTKYRGQLGICTGIFISTGYALCNWIDLGFGYLPSSTAQWRAPLAIPFLFSAIMLVSVFAFPESPRWLVSKGRVEEATSSLTQYRGTEPPEMISREITSIQLALASTKSSSLKDILNRNDKTRLHFRFWLCMGLNFFQQACGGNLISVYSSTIFENYLHMSPEMAKILASCVLMWKTLCCVISFWAIDRLGRRACFMISGTGMALCMAVLAITTSFNTITHPMAITYVAFMFIFNFFYPIGFMGGNFLYTAEIAPARLRAAISSLATANHWLWNLVVVLVTPVAIDTIGFWYYVIYAGISSTIPITVYLLYPETMGRSLEMLDRVFVEAESVWRIVPMARGLPGEEVVVVESRPGEEKANAAGEVEMREYRPLTYSEKVLYTHLPPTFTSPIERGTTQLPLHPIRIACQDATAQMALIQFISAGLDRTAVPTTIHCDHLIVSRDGEAHDLPRAVAAHHEVYEFLESASQKYAMGFWKPGAGIIHQIVLENYAFPGGLMIGTDSHTPNAGGLGMLAIGVGGADAVDGMAGLPVEVKAPRVLGVRLTGRLSGWAAAKDIVNAVVGELSVKGGTGAVIEYFGPGVGTLSATGMATVCNMGAETGATTSVFPFAPQMGEYLRKNGREEMARAVEGMAAELRADEGAEYDRVVEIDLSRLEPRINGPFTPDLSTPLSRFGEAVEEKKWPGKLTAGLIGSCTNSSFEDMGRAASLAQQALDVGLKPKMPLLVSPGSLQTRDTLEEAGVLSVFEKLGATMLPNACGPCCGSWDRVDMPKGTPNSIITSYNRNFSGRLDSNPATNVFLASPELVMAKVFSDDLSFDPSVDALTTPSGDEFRFLPPTGDTLPQNGYLDSNAAYKAPPADRGDVEVKISPTSDRLQRLAPFAPWSGQDFHDCLILIKTKGKCTTDHITPAGPWFRYRGHLENISNNTLIGAVNAENGLVNTVRNQLTQTDGDVPSTAREYQAHGQPWVVIADHNYGEGSSREHAALQPRYLGGVAIIAKSFARIHEANLKKQGMLALTFADESDYDRIRAADRVSIVGLNGLEPGKTLRLVVNGEWEAELNHTFTWEQIEYFKAGSALNLMAKK
ncbi:aconitase [Aspergillus sclerotiicarbonarius CBS 121057]|uniref:Aconitase n=1 Tax=Aspergillus sclerotiicarbonarius (strain CBS 121057 / IBT 28362) TaxID=1448318 RepID=A0A319EGP0_ASPSB|nr:aconitase [Aspergillus sclerotiicarbonarius CBS 121057]